ncbi:MAG: hypothetical protein CMN06_02745 [Roseibacillus sp.]|nr:hypothetical protein [Roseibacillus sp.]|tara:strand:- start:3903 stop:4556 length:654 start_codon:yes stop_codon:yes gene_type:complete
MSRFTLIALSITLLAFSSGILPAGSPTAAEGHDSFIEGLREEKEPGAKSVSTIRTLSPVVSRFKGWFIDVTDRAKASNMGDVETANGISLASKARDSSGWQFIETENGYLVRAAGGKFRGWVIARDDRAKTRPEGPNLTVTPALRLANRVTDNCHWKLILTEQGLVLEALSGKYKGWFWDFGGGDPSHQESGREVSVNVLLAEKVVAGSYFAVRPAK